MNEIFAVNPKKTKTALLWMGLANEPFVVLYALLPFIIRKDLQASILQLSILASLRPVLSIFSFYWSAHLTRQTNFLRSNLMSAWFLARVSFLLTPWFHSSWFLIFCCAMYELLHRSGNPALIEMLKINVEKGMREKIYNLCFVLSFLESILLGFVIAYLLGIQFIHWQTLFSITVLISLSSLFLQIQIPVPQVNIVMKTVSASLIEKIAAPWKEAYTLLKERPDFFRFQWGFMWGGIGLMLAAPSLSLFCVDLLQLTHGEITTGRSILMGIGVAISSYFWRRMITKHQISKMLCLILIGFASYLISLYFAKMNLLFFYFAFTLYGLAQGGSHLLWNLSGPIFSGQEESSQFSRVNVLMVGLRGAFAPAIGGVLCNYLGPSAVILISAAVCLGSAGYCMLNRRVFNFL